MAILKFWGVQGSCSGSSFKESLGSNTSCVSIEYDKTLIILDSGTGIRILSESLNINNYENIILFITHSHWDHVQGFPFFKYLFNDCNINIFCHNNNHYEALINQLNGTNFPLDFENIIAKTKIYNDLEEINKIFNFNASIINTNHHGDCIGIRIKSGTFDVTYIPDNQLHSSLTQKTSKDEFINFCNSTSLLIHDSQYTLEDMPIKKDWGHSIYTDALNLAIASNVKEFALFHHDPTRSKSEILEFVSKCQKIAPNIKIYAAEEGLSRKLLGNEMPSKL